MRWTRKAIVEEIRRLFSSGEELNYSSVEENHLNLVRAAAWHFGTWKRAIEKSGLDYEDISKYQRWSRERVVERILELHQEGKDLSWRAVSMEVDPPLAAAALRPNSGFETWYEAITAAGLNHDDIARYRRWTKERVLEELKARAEGGEPMSSIMVQRQNPSLYCAAKRRFLQWDKALEAAGLNPDKIRIRRAPASPSPFRRRRGAKGQLLAPEATPAEEPKAKRQRRRHSDIPTPEETLTLFDAPAPEAAPAPAKGGRKKQAPVEPAVVEAAPAPAPAKKAATAKAAAPKPAAPKPAAAKAAAPKATVKKAPAEPAPAPEPVKPARAKKAAAAPAPAPEPPKKARARKVDPEPAPAPEPSKKVRASKAAAEPAPTPEPAKKKKGSGKDKAAPEEAGKKKKKK